MVAPAWFRGNHDRTHMAKKKGVRPVITLECTDCQERNYTTEKNRRNDPGRMELKKYCPRCKAHTLHREVK